MGAYNFTYTPIRLVQSVDLLKALLGKADLELEEPASYIVYHNKPEAYTVAFAASGSEHVLS